MGRYLLLYEKGNGNARAPFGGPGAKGKGSKGSGGSKGSKGGGGGFAAVYSLLPQEGGVAAGNEG